MPAKTLWLLQIPEIVALLETFDVPVVDRAIIERLFGLRRRQAIEFCTASAVTRRPYILLDRRLLIEHLRRLADGKNFSRKASAKNVWTTPSISSAGIRRRRA